MNTYKGQIVKVTSDYAPIDFKFVEVPDGATMSGLIWTANADITKEQIAFLMKCCAFRLRTPERTDFLRVTLRHIPMVMDMGRHDAFLLGTPSRRLVYFSNAWTGEYTFHDREGNEEDKEPRTVWNSFPGRAWIRMEAVTG